MLLRRRTVYGGSGGIRTTSVLLARGTSTRGGGRLPGFRISVSALVVGPLVRQAVSETWLLKALRGVRSASIHVLPPRRVERTWRVH